MLPQLKPMATNVSASGTSLSRPSTSRCTCEEREEGDGSALRRAKIFTHRVVFCLIVLSALHAFFYPLTHPPNKPPSHSLIHALIHSLTHSLDHSLTHTLTHSLTQPASHSVIHSLTHPPGDCLGTSPSCRWPASFAAPSPPTRPPLPSSNQMYHNLYS